MATANALPAMDKISLVGIWIETLLYGINCVIYPLSMFILLQRPGKIPPLRWILLVMSTILFLLCTVHVGASLRQLLDAFIYAPTGVPNYSILYWLDPSTQLRLLKNCVYIALVINQDLILIWRLYVVFGCHWRIVIIPMLLEAAYVGTAYATVALISIVGLYGSVVPSLSLAASVLSIVLDASITLAIASRLWWMGRRVARLTATAAANHYKSTIIIIVESGAIFAAVEAVMLALYVQQSPATLSGIDSAAQIAALTPLLIVVRVGHTGWYHASPDRNPYDSVVDEKSEFRDGLRGPLGKRGDRARSSSSGTAPSETTKATTGTIEAKGSAMELELSRSPSSRLGNGNDGRV